MKTEQIKEYKGFRVAEEIVDKYFRGQLTDREIKMVIESITLIMQSENDKHQTLFE